MKRKIKKKCDQCGRYFMALRTIQRFCPQPSPCRWAYWSRVRSEGDRAFREAK